MTAVRPPTNPPMQWTKPAGTLLGVESRCCAGSATDRPHVICPMADVAFKLALLVLLLAWSGYFVYCLATGVLDAWKLGRFGVYEKNKPTAHVVRSSAHAIEFWFIMTFWHVMLVVFVAVFVFGIYGVWRVLASP